MRGYEWEKKELNGKEWARAKSEARGMMMMIETKESCRDDKDVNELLITKISSLPTPIDPLKASEVKETLLISGSLIYSNWERNQWLCQATLQPELIPPRPRRRTSCSTPLNGSPKPPDGLYPYSASGHCFWEPLLVTDATRGSLQSSQHLVDAHYTYLGSM
ncbi:hypothetical protein BJ165DRAFT_268075 [Panaeolus papilionaceus]|nr:hypothetical protein BJ165DRAFT_268075 [Panaeolus papilionaceus]